MRMCEKEDWKAIQQERGCANIAVEINRYIDSVMEVRPLCSLQCMLCCAACHCCTATIAMSRQCILTNGLESSSMNYLLTREPNPQVLLRNYYMTSKASAPLVTEAGNHHRLMTTRKQQGHVS